MKNKLLCILAFLFLLPDNPAYGTEQPVFTTVSTPQKLNEIFARSGYNNYLPDKNHLYPRIFIKSFPEGFAKLPSDGRSKLFFMALAPLALKINEQLQNERQVVIYLKHKFAEDKLDKTDEEIIEKLAAKYDIFTRMKGHRQYAVLLKQLELKIDIIPPSVFLAAAAISTDYGKAPFLAQSDNLYKELVWYSKKGLKPGDEKEDDSYRLRIFPSLYAAMQSYTLKLNSSVDFAEFRDARKRLRISKQTISGRFLAPYLLFDTDIPNYAGLLDYTITFYNLQNLDKEAQLSEPAGENPQKSQLSQKINETLG